METFTPRMYIKDFRRLKRLIPPRKDETLANYFNRVVNRIEGIKYLERQNGNIGALL